MARIRIITVGKRKEKYLLTAVDEFEKRLSPKKIEYIIIKPSTKAAEGENILAQSKGKLISLDERGANVTSVAFAQLIKQSESGEAVTFVIGGPDGLDEIVRKKANIVLQLSAMTLTHEMAYLLLLEQIYRGYSILENRAYHRA